MKVVVVEIHKQYMHLQIESQKQGRWWFIVVYTSPNRAFRRMLWTELFQIKDSITGPWCIGGDFDATVLAEERRSNAASKTTTDSEFVRWIDDMNLADLGFEGPLFTWKCGSTEARLDRLLANEAWCS